MDIQLSELIEKIKKEGIETAQAEASRLKTAAESEAQKIVEDARHQAGAIVAKAEEDAKRSEAVGIAALEQAARNLVLAFKAEIQGFLDKLITETVSSAYSLDIIKRLLPDLIKNWAVKNTDSLTVLLSEGDLKKLDDASKTSLASALKGGVVLKPEKTIGNGFRIAEKDGSAFYDFSAESVALMLSAYLSPKLADTLKKAVEGN